MNPGSLFLRLLAGELTAVPSTQEGFPDGAPSWGWAPAAALCVFLLGLLVWRTYRKATGRGAPSPDTMLASLRNAAAYAREGIFVVGAEPWNLGRIVAVNAAGTDMYGYAAGEMVTMARSSLEAPGSAGREEDFYDRMIGGGQAAFEAMHRRKDGSVFPVDVRGGLVDVGGHRSFVLYETDASSRRNNEQALNDVVALLSATLDSTADAILVLDRNGRIERINRKFLELWNIPAGSPLDGDHRKIAEWVFPQLKSPEEFMRKTKALLGRPDGEHCETIELADGRIVEWYTRPRRRGSESAGWVSSYRDVTDQRRMEATLSASEKKFRSLIEMLGEGLMITDMDNMIQFCNEKITRMFGYTKQELMCQPADLLLCDDVGRRTLQEKTQLRLKSIADTYEVSMRRKDGSVMRVHVSGTPFFDGQGNVIGSIGVFSDITEQKRMDEQIKSSLREKEMLLKEIHHRVKNNLQVVSSLLNLQSGYVKDRAALQVLKESQNRVKSMALIHERLYQSGSLVEVNVADYLQSLAASLFRSYRSGAERVRLRMDVADVRLGVDNAMTCGLIINELISNSLKYAFPGKQDGGMHKEQEPEIHVEMRDLSGGEVLLRVEDNGVGIPSTVDFRHTDSLGLQLVNTLTDQLKGVATLERAAGTDVSIRFPR